MLLQAMLLMAGAVASDGSMFSGFSGPPALSQVPTWRLTADERSTLPPPGLGIPLARPNAAPSIGLPTPQPLPPAATPERRPTRPLEVRDIPPVSSPEPAQPETLASSPIPSVTGDAGDLNAIEGGFTTGCDTCYRGRWSGTWYGDWWYPGCDMSQHHPYCPEWQGYYYFQPQHIVQLRQQQEAVEVWGGDPSNLSDNRFLDRVTEAFLAESPTETHETPTVLPEAPAEQPPAMELIQPKAPSQLPTGDQQARFNIWQR